MKKRYFVVGSIIISLFISYYVDKGFFMKKRVLKHNLWEHNRGERVRGDFIHTGGVTFKGDTMIFGNSKDTLLLKYQYFSVIKVLEPKTNKSGRYTMKGAYWTDYLFK